MPEPVPTTGKKGLSKRTIYIIAGLGGLGLVLLWKSKKKEEAKGAETNPYTAQSFIPVTAENVGGVGAGGGSLGSGEGSGGLIQAQQQNQEFLEKFFKAESERSEKREEIESGRFEKIIEHIGNQTGGGSPHEGQINTGGGNAGSPSGGTPAGTPPLPVLPTPQPKITAKCPGSYPLYNPGNGPPGPHSCYKYSHDRCPNKAMPYKHVYEDGKVRCSPV